jgi:hypothetical protein
MRLTKGVAELIGVLIGDGYIYTNNRKYQIGFVGSPKTDREYFEKLKVLILNEWNKNITITLRERGLRIILYSKEICNFLINELKLEHGQDKCENVIIPEPILKNWDLAKHTIRGIVDTDGSVFVSDKPGAPNYPSIEITTTSLNLALQLKSVLESRNFRVAKYGNINLKPAKEWLTKSP